VTGPKSCFHKEPRRKKSAGLRLGTLREQLVNSLARESGSLSEPI